MEFTSASAETLSPSAAVASAAISRPLPASSSATTSTTRMVELPGSLTLYEEAVPSSASIMRGTWPRRRSAEVTVPAEGSVMDTSRMRATEMRPR